MSAECRLPDLKQAVNQDLADAIAEREQLNEQVQDYIVEVKRIEEMLAAKERERSNLLEQYRSGQLLLQSC